MRWVLVPTRLLQPSLTASGRSVSSLSDSGGVQEEAPALGKPVLVLRDETERPEAVTLGCNRLVGTNTQRIVDEVTRLLSDPKQYEAMASAGSPYGDGQAAQRIEAVLREHFC